MALMPKRTKFRKVQRRNFAPLGGLARSCNKLDFGEFGLQALDRGLISNNQIEAARIAINRHINRRGRVWIRIFPDKPFTKKPLGVRMGSGKGNTEGWVAVVKPGRVMFEVSGCTFALAKEALCRAAAKLGVKTKLLAREQH